MKFHVFTLLILWLSPVVFGQQAKLEGHVFDDRERPVEATRVVAPGGQAAETDSKGHFTISFPSTIRPGQATRIDVDRKDWVIYEPLMGNCVTQSVERNFEPLKVIIVPKSSSLALQPKRLAQVIAKWSDER
ncbi:MAG: hypothetical protein JNN15_20325, partial [Blastocatellia bacterium]|nr:hypothetical protein [Blastocatellia bacterium]